MAATPVRPQPARAVPPPIPPARAGRPGTVQAMFDYDMDEETYSDTGIRPKKFNANAERSLVATYNTQHSTSVKKVDYAGEDRARCHIDSFDDIRQWLVAYLNDPDGQWATLVHNVTQLLSNLDPKLKERKDAEKALDQFTGSVSGKESSENVIKKGSKLLTLLNSISKNLRPGNTYVNSYLGQFFDPYATQSSGGKYSFTGHTKTMFGLGDQISDVLRTPTHESRIITSNGVYGRGDLTPTSETFGFGHSYTTRNIKSDNVKDLVYGLNSTNF